MTVIDNDVDYVSAPKNYADLFEKYYAYMVNFCAQQGIDDNDKEDVASDIFLRFMERGSLEKFDSTLSFYYRGELHPARFRSYLSRAVEMYTRGHRDRLKKQARRELQICDATPGINTNQQRATFVDSSNGGAQTSWAEIYGEAHQDHADGVHNMLDEQAEAATVRTLLAQVPPRRPGDRCDLVALFDAARAQIIAYGEYDIAILRTKFGVSSTAMHTWMWWLKENLATIYGLPVPPRRPRRTRCKDDDCGCKGIL